MFSKWRTGCAPSLIANVVRHFEVTGKSMRATVYLALLFAVPMATEAGIFGEGYSSDEPGGPAAIHFRAFTLYTGKEACERSPLPVKLRVFPAPLHMRIGDRIHRSNINERPSELVIEAYDKDGAFLAAVPIIVSTLDERNITESRSDWDYLEAIRAGEAELVVASACSIPNSAPIEARVGIVVIAGNAEAVNLAHLRTV